MAKAQVTSDGRTVWVNDLSGVCIGRFSPYAFEVHRDLKSQRTHGECLHCEHSALPVKLTRDHWERWKASMLQHYQVVVSDKHQPRWLS